MGLVDEVNVLVNQYLDFMRNRINLREVGKHVAISTPFLNRHNDGYVIFVNKISDEKYILTDDGETITDLEQSGCKINTPLRQHTLNTILMSNGVLLHNDELTIETTAEEFAFCKNNLLNAMMEVSDMYMLSETNVRNFFFEDVRSWLGKNDVKYILDAKRPGHSGYQFPVDFLIPHRNEMETALQTLASPDVTALAKMILMKNELKYRNTNVHVMMNDTDLSPRIISDLTSLSESQELNISFWSKSENLVKTLIN